MGSLSNISLAEFRKFLLHVGCARIRKSGGHEMWARQGMRRSITLQTHIDPIPERIVRQSLRNLDITREEFEAMIQTL
jgi:hypothetical protein